MGKRRVPRNKIRWVIDKKKKSIYQISKDTGLCWNTINAMAKDEWKAPATATVEAFLNAYPDLEDGDILEYIWKEL